jgi:hypothetical protein
MGMYFISQGSSVEEAVVQPGVGGDEEEDAVADEQVGPQPIVPLEEKQEPEDDLGRPQGAVSPEGTSLNKGGACVPDPQPEDHVEITPPKLAPVSISGSSVYVAWWTNDTENNNEEVIFRASTDDGGTFGEKIDLSNFTDSDFDSL